jgi:hypothetical protein
MLKFAFAAGIVYEWLFGATVFTLPSLESAVIHTVCATLLAWMVLETCRVLLMAAMSLDDRPPRPRRG